MLSGNRLVDNKEKTGPLTYTSEILRYGEDERIFDIWYSQINNEITVLLRIKIEPYVIHLRDKKTGQIKLKNYAAPQSVPFDTRVTINNGAMKNSNYVYHFVERNNVRRGFEEYAKKSIEQILNTPSYQLTIDSSTCQRISICHYKVPIKFQVEIGKNIHMPHVTIKVFPLMRRANAKNWGEEHVDGKDIARVLAHETGHLLGWPDEYYKSGGAVHRMYIKPNLQIDTKKPEPRNSWKRRSSTNLMGMGKRIPPYYMEHIQNWFEKKTGYAWEIEAF